MRKSHADVSSRDSCLILGLSVDLHPYFVKQASNAFARLYGCADLSELWPLTFAIRTEMYVFMSACVCMCLWEGVLGAL